MMGHRQVEQAALFYEFSLEEHIPADHLVRSIDRFVELGDLRRELAGFYSNIGRPSIDPELMIRMLLIGYCFGIRSERRLCEEVHLNLAYRWFCQLGLDGACLITRPSRRTGTDVSARAISSGACSRPCCAAASRSGWSAVKASPSTQA
jgi:transposase